MKINNRQENVLGVVIDSLDRNETVKILSRVINERGRSAIQVVTAYSEFFVRAIRDSEFRKVLREAELVLPDGIGPLAAIDYQKRVKPGESELRRFWTGFVTGVRVLTGKVGRPVSGVWLFEELIRQASRQNWRVFLLGGYGETAAKVVDRLKRRYPGLEIGFDPGDQNVVPGEKGQEEIIRRVNEFGPEVVFVAYGPGKQEKWIALNRKRIRAKVIMGVGGTFDEVSGRLKAAPQLFEQSGLKWLWRVIQEPKRIGRIFDAIVVFPWLVYKQSK